MPRSGLGLSLLLLALGVGLHLALLDRGLAPLGAALAFWVGLAAFAGWAQRDPSASEPALSTVAVGPSAWVKAIPLLFIAGLYGTIATRGATRFDALALSPVANEPYQQLAEGYSMGRLGLSLDPDPRLLGMKEPLNPLENGCCRVIDMCYKDGKLYMLHGPLPVLAFVWPLHALTGAYPSGTLTVAFFASLSFLALYATLLLLRERHFKASPLYLTVLGGMGLGLMNLGAYFITIPRYNFSCAAASAAFLSLGAYALLRAFTATGLSIPWVAAASMATALAAAGRMNMSLGAAAFCLALTAWMLARMPRGLQRTKALAALWAPMLAVGAALAWHNWARFGDPFEFGFNYQFGSDWMAKLQLYPWASMGSQLWHNVKFYLFQRCLFSAEFPWARPAAKSLYLAGGYYASEDSVGLFSLWPAGWLIVMLPAALAAWRRKAGAAAGALIPWAAVVGSSLAVIALTILGLNIGTMRYLSDFGPALVLLAWLSCMLLREALSSRRWRRLLEGAFVVAAVYGIWINAVIPFWGFHGRYHKEWTTGAPAEPALSAESGGPDGR